MKVQAVLCGMILLAFIPVLSQGVQTPPSVIGPCWVIDVQDGDSITVRTEDEETIAVRYMAIDAPEKESAFGEEALNRNDELVGGRSVWLEVNSVNGGYQSDRDGRVLAYVFLDATCSQSVQQILVSEGLALIDVRDVVDRDLYPGAFSIRHSELLIRSQIEAACGRRGLWGDRVPEAGGLIVAAIEFWGEIEAIYLVNAGDEKIDLAANWILMDEYAHDKLEKGEGSRNVLEFGRTFGPECALLPRGVLKISTGPGIPEVRRGARAGCGSDEVIFYWFGYKIWDTDGDTAFLYSPDGQLYFTYQYPWQERGA